MSDFTRRHTELLAKLGYVVFAPDIYGKTVRPKTVPEFVEQSKIYNADRPLMRARAQAGFDVLRQQPDGRCRQVGCDRLLLRRYRGGRVRATGAPALGTVAIHGSFRNHEPEAHKNIKGRFLILHGAEDPIAPLDEVNKLIKDFRAAKVEWQMEMYSGAEHGFSTPQEQGRGTRKRAFHRVHVKILQRDIRQLTCHSSGCADA